MPAGRIWFLLVVLAIIAFIWIRSLKKLEERIAKRHPEKYRELGLDSIGVPGERDRVFNRMLRFLRRGDYRYYNGPEVANLGAFLRWTGVAFLGVFFALAWSVAAFHNESVRAAEEPPRSAGTAAAQHRENRREQAFELHRRNKLAEAIVIYDELLRARPNDAELLYWRGNARSSLGRDEDALGDYRRAIELTPGDIEVYEGADRVLSLQKRWGEALELWHAYLKAVPKDAQGYYHRGRAYFNRGDKASARQDASRSCELGKKDACELAKRLETGKP
jgi:tetratricopeptide (TPR) repeat protein